MTLAELEASLDEAIAAKHIWNVDYVAFKERLGHIIEESFSGYHVEDVGDHEAFWNYFHPLHYCNAATLLGKAKKIDKLPNDKKWPEIKNVLRSLVPACEKIATVKQFVEKGRKPSENPSVNVRTVDHTGTCGCCMRNIKLRSEGTMWDHGYFIRNVGKGKGKDFSPRTQYRTLEGFVFAVTPFNFRVGSCFGVGYKPIEVSPEVWDAMLLHMQKRQQTLPDQIASVKTWLVNNPKTPENAKTHMMTQRSLFYMEQELEQLPSDIKSLRARRANWKARPLPDQRKEK
jgi:hypothetical protein